MLSYEYYKYTDRRMLIICEYDTRQELLVFSEKNEPLHSLYLPSEFKLKKIQINTDAKYKVLRNYDFDVKKNLYLQTRFIIG